MFLKHKILTLFGIALFPVALSASDDADNNRQRQYKDILYLENIRYGIDNPTSVSYSPLNHTADIKIGYNYKKGDFVNIDKSPKEKTLFIDMSGTKKLKKTAFEGGIGYQNTIEYDRRWNSTLYIASDNPFILADSVRSKYNVEKFILNGGFSWDALSFMKFGIKAHYEVGSSADQTDPRPDTKGMRFNITPGLDFKLSEKLSIGVSLGGRLLNEEIKYTNVVGTTNYNFFLMNGLGCFYLQNGTSYQRRYKGSGWYGNLQLIWNNRSFLSNIVSLGIDKNSEKAEDGGTQRLFIGGKYNRTQYNIYDRFSILHENSAHNITISASIHQIDGIWYDQKSVTNDNGQTYWEIVNSSIKHKEDRLEGTLKYRFDLLRHSVPTLTVNTGINFVQSKTTNYPDIYLQKYNNLIINADISKHFSIKKSLLTITFSGNYKFNLSSSLYSDGITLAEQYTIPMFDYLTANHYGIYGKIESKIPLNIQKLQSYIGIYLQGSTQQYTGKSVHYSNTSYNQIEGGIQFLF